MEEALGKLTIKKVQRPFLDGHLPSQITDRLCVWGSSLWQLDEFKDRQNPTENLGLNSNLPEVWSGEAAGFASQLQSSMIAIGDLVCDRQWRERV